MSRAQSQHFVWCSLHDEVDDLVLEHDIGVRIRDEERDVVSLPNRVNLTCRPMRTTRDDPP